MILFQLLLGSFHNSGHMNNVGGILECIFKSCQTSFLDGFLSHGKILKTC